MLNDNGSPDMFDGRERPGDSLIQISDTRDQTIITIPPRPLILPLKVLLSLHGLSICFLVLVGILYLCFHIALFTGLPEPRRVFTGHAAEYRWYAEIAIGWVLAVAAIVTILGLVWIPQIATESLCLDRTGVHWRRDGWWRHERLDASWSEINEIVVLGSLQEIAPNRLAIQLFNGRDQAIAENTSNRERSWLEYVLDRAASRYRGI